MSRILYGLCGVGVGHVIRTKVIIDELSKKNEIMIVCSHWPYQYLSKIFKYVYMIEGFELAFKNNSIIDYLTLFINLKKFSRKTFRRLELVEKIVNDFKPDVVISDWETFSSLLAKRYRIPLISLDNQHFLIKGRLEFPKRYFWSYLKTRLIVMLLMRRPDYYIISSFYETRLKRMYKNVFLVPPILRDEVFKAKPRRGDYLLVYQSTDTYDKLISILKMIDHKFIVYGFGRKKREKNLVFKAFSERKFLNDLINCRAVICNGGFSLIGEAIQLKKPILSIPIKGHFEQLLNAMHVKLKGYGESCDDLNINVVESFIKNLDSYKIKKVKQKDNSEIFEVINKIIKK